VAESITADTIPVTPGSGKLLDAAEVTVGANSVDREVVVIGDPATGTQYAEVTPKGTQADNALGVQALKDSGRSYFHLSIPAQSASSSSSPTAIQNMTQNSNFTQSTGVTSFAIPSGKTLRLQHFSAVAAPETVSSVSTSKAVMVVQIRVASASTSTAVAAGTIVAQVDIPMVEATAVGNAVPDAVSHKYPDGIDIPYGNATGNFIGVTFMNGTANAVTMILLAGSIVGFTY
jgi:hypothetical protein